MSELSSFRLVLNSLRYYWRTHLGVLLGATLATAVLVGSLAVGDSVRFSLKALALARIGEVRYAVVGGDRFFRAELARELHADLGAVTAAVIQVRGTVGTSGGTRRANQVHIVGVTDEFWKLGPSSSLLPSQPDAVVLNDRLAEQLAAGVGEEVLVRVERPGWLSREAPLSRVTDASTTMRLTVTAIAHANQFGHYSLAANQLAPSTAFVPLATLQHRLDRNERANVLLLGGSSSGKLSTEKVETAVAKRLQPADGGLRLTELPGLGVLQLSSSRVFLDDALVAAARRAMPSARAVFTYFVNRLRHGNRVTPYSFVAAMEGGPVPAGMDDDEIVVNRWLAQDLHVRAGDPVILDYYVLGTGRKLEEKSSTFRVRGVIPLTGVAADRTLTPAYPGLLDVENCRDWAPGVPLDLSLIRDKDEQYWNRYRATPKAFITLTAGRRLWHNRFGNVTALRCPLRPGARENVLRDLRRHLTPGLLGLVVQPVRRRALNAAAQALDFGSLFLGLSFFLLAAAVVLTGLLFVFGVEQRAAETGTLLALGLPPRTVLRLLLAEGGILAAAGGVLGMVSGVLYTREVVHALTTVWRGAVAHSALQYHATPATLAGGAIGGFLVALLAVWLSVRKQVRAPARALLAGGAGLQAGPATTGDRKRPLSLAGGAASTLAAVVLVGVVGARADRQAAAVFFTAGSLLLLGGLGLCHALLGGLDHGAGGSQLSLAGLGVRNSGRRRGRSLATIALLAAGSFLVVAVGANRKDPTEDADKRWSGTGGFAFIGETTLPVYVDLNTPAGRDRYALAPDSLEGVTFVPLRVHDGDDASCLNLNRAQLPRVLGVRPDDLLRRRAFTFVKTIDGRVSGSRWDLLNLSLSADTVPAIGDTDTIVWGLEKKVGDKLAYVDGRGKTFQLEIVGTIAGSVLQGNLLISEQRFLRRFPGDAGYRMFLIDAPRDQTHRLAALLPAALADAGLTLTPAPRRLAELQTVENTYLSIFALLGGLGLLLGSVGLGAVVLRNVLERRHELAVLRAVGFRRDALLWMLFCEHFLLLTLGLAVGVLSAVVAVLPALRSPGAHVPVASLAWLLLLVLLSGMTWTGLATWFSIRGPLLPALRTE